MWKVEIVSYDTGEVVKTMDAESERQADRIDRGVNINLNHEKFFTRVVETEQ